MSPSPKPVTEELVKDSPSIEMVIDYLADELPIPLSNADRQRRWRVKHQLDRKYHNCLTCDKPLISKWGTIRGTDDADKAICKPCKDAEEDRLNKETLRRRQQHYKALRRDKYLSWDGRYEGPYNKSEEKRNKYRSFDKHGDRYSRFIPNYEHTHHHEPDLVRQRDKLTWVSDDDIRRAELRTIPDNKRVCFEYLGMKGFHVPRGYRWSWDNSRGWMLVRVQSATKAKKGHLGKGMKWLWSRPLGWCQVDDETLPHAATCAFNPLGWGSDK